MWCSCVWEDPHLGRLVSNEHDNVRRPLRMVSNDVEDFNDVSSLYDSKWKQARPSETRRDQTRPSEAKWNHGNWSATQWDQMHACEDQINSNKGKRKQVKRSQIKRKRMQPKKTLSIQGKPNETQGDQANPSGDKRESVQPNETVCAGEIKWIQVIIRESGPWESMRTQIRLKKTNSTSQPPFQV